MKYPIGIQSFENIISNGYVYVDKTKLIYELVDGGKIYFLSRPRRFGKSLLVSTLESYFLGRQELFKGLAIEQLETEWLTYPVFHIDFNGEMFNDPGALEDKINRYLTVWEQTYTPDPAYKSIGARFEHILQKAHEATGRRCVVLIDEYDKPLLDVFDSMRTVRVGNEDVLLSDRNRELLRGFFSTLKAADAHLQFVLLTGVTKFSQVSIFSGFNQAKDISMDSRFDALCGITAGEIDRYFSHAIADMARAEEVTEEDMRQMLKRHYDGYHFSRKMTDIYNPFSLLNALDRQEIGNYWFSTGSPDLLMRMLPQSGKNINELAGQYFEADQFYSYKATHEDLLPLIYQSGYFTIKGYDPGFRTFKLDFPNVEVGNGFLTALSGNYFSSEDDTKSMVRQLVMAMQAGDTDRMRDLLTAFLADVPYEVRRKDTERERERYFQLTLYMIFRLASAYTVTMEKHQSQGRADCIVETPGHIYIFEFKLDGTAAEALKQIEEKGYAQSYKADPRQLHKIGASFSSQSGTIAEWEAV